MGKYNYVYYRAGKAKAISRIVTFFLQFQNTGNLGLYFWQFSSMIGTAFDVFLYQRLTCCLKAVPERVFMNTGKQQTYTAVSVVIDAIVLTVSYVISYLIQFALQNNLAPFDSRNYWPPLMIIVISYLMLYAFFHIYGSFRMTGRRKEAVLIGKVNIIGALILFAVFFVISNTDGYNWIVGFSRMMILWMTILNTIFMVVWRNIFRFILRKLGNSRFNRKPVLIVGYSQAAEAYIERVLTHKQWGYDILGILDDHLHTNESVRGISVLGPIESLEEYLSKNIAESIIITLKLKEYDRLEEIVHVCEKSGVHTEFVPDYNDIISTKPYTVDFLGLPLIHIRHVPLMEAGNAFIKACDGYCRIAALHSLVFTNYAGSCYCSKVKLTGTAHF